MPALAQSPLTFPHCDQTGDLTRSLPRGKLRALARRDYWAAARQALLGGFRAARRGQDLVSAVYERHWDLDNQAYVEDRNARRDLFRHNGRLVYADGWYIIRAYVDLFTRIIDHLGDRLGDDLGDDLCDLGDGGVRSVLEVGAGRGKNLALLALRRPGLKYAGLELTHQGVLQSRALVRDLPPKYLEVACVDSLDEERRQALERIDFHQGSALDMPFADQSFDFSFTCLVLEQLPARYPRVLQEMRRVTRGYCAFLEAFHEANGILGRAYLRSMDYFRARYRDFRAHGLQPVSFTTAMPQKLRFNTGLLVARVV